MWWSALLPVDAQVLLPYRELTAGVLANYIATDIASTVKEIRRPALSGRAVVVDGLLEEYAVAGGVRYVRRWWRVANPHGYIGSVTLGKVLAWVGGTIMGTCLPGQLLGGTGVLVGLGVLGVAARSCPGPAVGSMLWGWTALQLAPLLGADRPVGAIAYGLWHLPAALEEDKPTPESGEYDPTPPVLPLGAAAAAGLGSLATPVSTLVASSTTGARGVAVTLAGTFSEAIGVGLALQGQPSSRTLLGHLAATYGSSLDGGNTALALAAGCLAGLLLQNISRLMPWEHLPGWAAAIGQGALLLFCCSPAYLAFCCLGGLLINRFCRHAPQAKSFVFSLASFGVR